MATGIAEAVEDDDDRRVSSAGGTGMNTGNVSVDTAATSSAGSEAATVTMKVAPGGRVSAASIVAVTSNIKGTPSCVVVTLTISVAPPVEVGEKASVRVTQVVAQPPCHENRGVAAGEKVSHGRATRFINAFTPSTEVAELAGGASVDGSAGLVGATSSSPVHRPAFTDMDENLRPTVSGEVSPPTVVDRKVTIGDAGTEIARSTTYRPFPTTGAATLRFVDGGTTLAASGSCHEADVVPATTETTPPRPDTHESDAAVIA